MITAIILTKNEEKNIVDCIESIKWCDEILLVDDKSDDRTKDLAKREGAKVFEHDLENNFSKQRNFVLEKAAHEWILFVDADERVSEPLRGEIQQVIYSSLDSYSGYFLKRLDHMWGRQLHHGENGNIRLLRLAKKGSGMWEGAVHETWKVKGKIGQLQNPLQHYPHQTIKEFLKEINYYTDLRSKELYKKGVKSYWFSILFYTKGKFLFNFVLKGGFLDGIPGFIVSILMSFHTFLVRSKLWQLSQKNRL